MTLTEDDVRAEFSEFRYDGHEPAYLLVDGTLANGTPETDTGDDADDADDADESDETWSDDDTPDVETDGGIDELELLESFEGIEVIQTTEELPVDATAILFGEGFAGGQYIR